MWFSVVCTLIDNDSSHHSGQIVVDSRGAAEWVYNKFWPPWWRVSLSIRASKDHVKLHSIWKRHCAVTHCCEQRCLDSNRQRQISRLDCEISSNGGKTRFLLCTVKAKIAKNVVLNKPLPRTWHENVPS